MLPALSDTIVAVATGWSASPLAVVRLSGSDAHALAGRLGCRAPGRFPRTTPQRLTLETGLELPADVLWFRAPRSFTGQDMVELHTIGCIPLVRVLAERLIALGARRATPGEFTARAYLSGKLGPQQVAAVLALIHAADGATAREAARLAGGAREAALQAILDDLLDLLARLEAGIDFVDEEDVRFITAAEVRAALSSVAERLAGMQRVGRAAARCARPHVALLGRPNAGKSSLFNALLGRERAIVSPLLGTTRDVVSAELDLGGAAVVLQDSAGLAASAAGLERAAQQLSHEAAEQADLVLWVHDGGLAWNDAEVGQLTNLPAERRLIVVSKCDAGPIASFSPPRSVVFVSVRTGVGLVELREAVAERLAARGTPEPNLADKGAIAAAAGAVAQAQALAQLNREPDLPAELLALEIRMAVEHLGELTSAGAVDATLARIFGAFCIGK